ncbi:hypothetical protein LIT13_15340, partial [Flavobacterium psychrophilum]|uniref:hypothetical protein n=1 Tax=Flavobacterium psychrophilum TaxID=96345 RepID=UPI001D0702C7
AKRVMEEHRAKATMVFHHLRSGGSMEKIVPKGDFFHLVNLSDNYIYFLNLKSSRFINSILLFGASTLGKLAS